SEAVGLNALEPVVRLVGRMRASFSPDWTLRLQGRRIATVHAPGIDVASDTASLHLLRTDRESFFAAPPRRRSLLSVERGDARWPIEPRVHGSESWQLRALPDAFDRIHVEVGSP